MLRALGVSAEAERVYLALCDAPTTTVPALAARLGTTVDVARQWLRQLGERGLVRLDAGAETIQMLAPDLALSGLLDAAEREAFARQRALATARISLPSIVERFRSTQPTIGGETAHVLPAGESVCAIESCLEEATEQIACLHLPDAWPPALGQAAAMVSRAAERGVPCQIVYEQRSMLDGEAADAMKKAAAAGAAVRCGFSRNALLLIDHQLAAAPLSRQPEGMVLLVRSHAFIALLWQLFESVWQSSTPLVDSERSVGHPRTNALDLELLRLMAAGLTDSAIARRLGVTERTVGRRSKSLFRSLDATTRFQAGAMAVRRGWL